MFFAGRRDFFFGLFLLYQAPRGCSFEPVLTESGYVHRSEDVGYRIQCGLLVWTNRQNIRTPEQFSSTAKELHSTVLNATHLSKGVIMGKLEGKVAVITGGATGIGRAAAKRLIEEGAFVFIFGRRQAELDAAVAALGPNARAVKGSVSDLADLDRLYAAVKADRGTLDIVFANAGRGGPEGLRLDDSAPAHGRSGGDRSGGCLSRVGRQQLHDRQRARRRRRPSATLTRHARPGAPFDYSERP